MTAVWMLPVVSPNVSAAAGGIIAPYLLPGEARLTIICSYLWLGISLPPAVCLMAIYYKRLALYKVSFSVPRGLPDELTLPATRDRPLRLPFRRSFRSALAVNLLLPCFSSPWLFGTYSKRREPAFRATCRFRHSRTR